MEDAIDDQDREARLRARLDALLMRVANVDDDAFAELYATLSRQVLQVATVVVRDPDLAEDVTQEVFDWVWREAGRFDQTRGSAQAWILTITKRRAVDLVRRESAWRRRQRADYEWGIDSTWEAVLAADLRDHMAVRMDQGMSSLTDLQRNAIMMSYGADRGYLEVAHLLGVNYSTVKSRIHSGIVQLRRQLLLQNAWRSEGELTCVR